MRYSRFGIAAVLLGVEVFIAGAIVWAFTGGHAGSGAGWSAATNVNRMAEQARIDAGSSPHVLINDADSRIVITASTDGKVHVTDHTHEIGWFSRPYADAKLTVERTADGVSITRGDGRPHTTFAFIGVDFQHTEVAVPPNSALDLQRCGGASISAVRASSVKIACGDGSLHFEDVQAPTIDARTADGSIRASNLHVDGGTLHTNDGSIRVALADANLTVHAQTKDGSIRFNGTGLDTDSDSKSADYHVGTGGGSLLLTTQDGSIHITTNGAQ